MADSEDIKVVKDKLRDIVRLNKIKTDNQKYDDYYWQCKTIEKSGDIYDIDIDTFEENVLSQDSEFKKEYEEWRNKIFNVENNELLDEFENYKEQKRLEFIKKVNEAEILYENVGKEMMDKRYSESNMNRWISFLPNKYIPHADKLLAFIESGEAKTLEDAISLLENAKKSSKNKSINNKSTNQQLKEIAQIISQQRNIKQDYEDRKYYDSLKEEERKDFIPYYIESRIDDNINEKLYILEQTEPILDYLKEANSSTSKSNKTNKEKKSLVSSIVSFFIVLIIGALIVFQNFDLSPNTDPNVVSSANNIFSVIALTLYILVLVIIFGVVIKKGIQFSKAKKNIQENDEDLQEEMIEMQRQHDDWEKEYQQAIKIKTEKVNTLMVEWLKYTDKVLIDYEIYEKQLAEYDILSPYYIPYADRILRILEDERASNLSGAITILEKDLEEEKFREKLLQQEQERTRMLEQDIEDRQAEQERHNQEMEYQAYKQSQEMAKQSEYARQQSEYARQQNEYARQQQTTPNPQLNAYNNGEVIDHAKCLSCIKRRTCSRTRCTGFYPDSNL